MPIGSMLGFAEALYGLYVEEDSAAGQGLVEYALILGFVAITVIVTLLFLRGQLGTLFWRVGTSLGGPSGPSGPFACPPPSMNPNCTP